MTGAEEQMIEAEAPGDEAAAPMAARGEPDSTVFSGAATLIRPCSQASDEPDPAMFLALKDRVLALYQAGLPHAIRSPALTC